MNIKKIHHIAIIVRSMDAMLSFYQNILGFRIKRDSIIDELKQKGVAFHSPLIRFEAPREIRGFKFVYLKDPEGNFIELNELPEGA